MDRVPNALDGREGIAPNRALAPALRPSLRPQWVANIGLPWPVRYRILRVLWSPASSLLVNQVKPFRVGFSAFCTIGTVYVLHDELVGCCN